MNNSKKTATVEPLPKVMTVSEVSEYLRIHPTTVYNLLREKKLPGGFRVGGEWRFLGETIDRWCVGERQPAIAVRRRRGI